MRGGRELAWENALDGHGTFAHHHLGWSPGVKKQTRKYHEKRKRLYEGDTIRQRASEKSHNSSPPAILRRPHRFRPTLFLNRTARLIHRSVSLGYRVHEWIIQTRLHIFSAKVPRWEFYGDRSIYKVEPWDCRCGYARPLSPHCARNYLLRRVLVDPHK